MKKLNLLKKLNIRKDDFKGYSLFATLLIFLLFLITYGGFGACLVLSVAFYLFLKISHFLFNLVKKVLGEVEHEKIK